MLDDLGQASEAKLSFQRSQLFFRRWQHAHARDKEKPDEKLARRELQRPVDSELGAWSGENWAYSTPTLSPCKVNDRMTSACKVMSVLLTPPPAPPFLLPEHAPSFQNTRNLFVFLLCVGMPLYF